jgi:hypothetical protein
LFVPESTVPLGSFSGGFSSTAGYVPGNEARQISFEKRERRGTHLADHFQRALLVFIRVTREDPKISPASLSASAPDVRTAAVRFLLFSNGASPRPFHLPVPVKLPVSFLTMFG